MNDFRNKIKLEEYGLENAHSSDIPQTYNKYDDNWNFDKFVQNFSIKIQKYSLNKLEFEFDIIGIDASIANSLRRILLSEIPTMAIEQVYVSNNTSVIQDEVLAHRLGLIPLKANPNNFNYKTNPNYDYTEDESLEFELKVKCQYKKNNEKEDQNQFIGRNVLTKHIRWIPIGNQSRKFNENDVLPFYQDILIAKLNPGQELDIKLVALKGIGKDHAKFSPVATAYYKLLSHINLKMDFYDEEAELLKNQFSPGVVKVVDIDGRKKAIIANSRNDTCCRQIFLNEKFKNNVEIYKLREHFLYYIESTGAWNAENLFKEAIRILRDKSLRILKEIQSTIFQNN